MKVVGKKMDRENKIVPIPDQNEIELVAAEWLLTLEEGDSTDKERAEFAIWLNSNARHREAFEHVVALWGEFDQAKVLADYAVSDENTALIAEDTRTNTRWGFFRPNGFIKYAASFVMIVGLGFMMFQYSLLDQPNPQGTYQTAVGEQKTIALPDGSTIELNTNSRIEYGFTDTSRDIRLISGEAFFDVASDKEKPFTVVTKSGSVTAIGTAFTVRVLEKKLNVLVSEGRVALSLLGMNKEGPQLYPENVPLPPKVIELIEGQSTIIENGTQKVIETVKAEHIIEKLSWRQGVLAFSGSPLSEVVADISRYTDIEIIVEDESLSNMPVSGYFGIGEVEEMFEALELMSGIKVERSDKGRIYLTRADAG